jgi:hypothetical protein
MGFFFEIIEFYIFTIYPRNMIFFLTIGVFKDKQSVTELEKESKNNDITESGD